MNAIRWLFGLGFLLMGASYITSHLLVALPALIISTILIPPVEKTMMSRFNLTISRWSKVILGVFMFGMMVSNIPASAGNQNAIIPEKKQEIEWVASPSAEVGAVSEPTSGEVSFYQVVKVIDGDTVQVSVAGKTQTIRLIGIDTPESVDPRKPVQCFAAEASKKAKELLTGKKVALEDDASQGDKDKYNRELRYIFLEDGTNFNRQMIAEGYGHEYTYDKPYKYMDEFKLAEVEARMGKRGLWADDACLTITTLTPKPTTVEVTPKPTTTTIVNTNTGSGYVCGTKTTCGQMRDCAEARYFLNTCGVSRLDGDKDGTPCESLCN